MNKGGYVNEESTKEILEKIKERPSWWLIDGKIVHCTSWELPIMKEIIDKYSK